MTAPTSPRNVQAAQSGNSGDISVFWRPPASSGDSPITSYVVTVNPDGFTLGTTEVSATFSFDSTGTWSFAVVAVNASGMSQAAQSNPVTITGIGAATPPSAPSGQPTPSLGAPQAIGAQVNTTQWGHFLILLLDDDIRIQLPVNPEEIDIDLPSRSAVTNTLGGAYLDAWGAGVGTILLSGTTGWRIRQQGGPDGHQVMMQLVDLHQQYQDRTATKDPALVSLRVVMPPFTGAGAVAGSASATGGAANSIAGAAGAVHQIVSVGAANPTGQAGVYRVSSDRLKSLRSKNSPLVYRFEWTMTILDDLMHPAINPSKRFDLLGTAGTPPASGSSATALTGQLAPLQASFASTDGTQSPSDIATALGLDPTTTASLLALNQIQGNAPLPAATVLSIPQSLGL